MKKTIVVLCLCLLTLPLKAEKRFEHPTIKSTTSQLNIYGAADYPAISPLIYAFQQQYPTVHVNYSEFGTRNLYRHFLDHQPNNPDLMLSSAMDLQVKLVNDGYAQAYHSNETASLPGWASWRNEIFGFTYEPAVIAINSGFLSDEKLPENRAELLELIRRKGDQVRGRIGTFDIEKVGVGYLIWSHDSQQTGSYGRLLESFGAHQARLFPSSASMLQALANGEILIAYNVLGSYAHAWSRRYPVISVILPSDYTTLVMRSAFIPKEAPNAAEAKRFLDFLLSKSGQQILADQSSLYPIREDITGETTAKGLRVSSNRPLRPIPLGLQLLVLTDQMKRELLLEEWEISLKDFE